MKTRIATLAMVLFVLGIFVSTSTAAMTSSTADCTIEAYLQSQVQEMNCGEKGCGEQKKEGCKADGTCEKKKNCKKDCKKSCCEKDKEECSKEKGQTGCQKGESANKGCQKGESANKGCQKGSTCGK